MSLPLLAELHRRRVFRVLVGYGIAAFAVLQVIEPIMHALHLPDATLTYVVVVLALGFPVVVVIAWAFDVNEWRVEKAAPASAHNLKGARLALTLLAVGLIAAAPGLIWYFVWPGHSRPPEETGASTAPTPSIAVLPFADMSPGKDQEYFSDGIAEEILNGLAQVEGLRVIGRTSSFSFKGKADDLRTIADKLGVVTVLEGSVRKAGSRVRVTAQLIDAARGAHLWSQSFDRELTDIFSVQDQIAAAVVEALKVKLLAGHKPTSKAYRTASPEAYSHYLVGRQFLSRVTTDASRRAERAFEQALALDPGYALAHAWLSFVLRDSYNQAETPEAAAQYRRRALAEAEKAVALGPDLADAYAARAILRITWFRDWRGAEADLARAVTLNPGDARSRRRTALLLAARGRLEEAAVGLRRATELDPLDTPNWLWLGAVERARGHVDLERKAILRALEVAPESEDAHAVLARSCVLEGRPAAAFAESRFLREQDRLEINALAEHSLGHALESEQALEKLIAKYAHNSAEGVAEVYAWRGDQDRAFEWLTRALDAELWDVQFNPFLRNLLADPRWPLLLEKMNLR